MLYNKSCLGARGMRILPPRSVDLILCDLPYGMTNCSWDIVLPWEPLWDQYKRIIKKTGVICLFSSQPFTTDLICSNREMFKYCWYWKKSKPNGWQHSKNKPMSTIEEICVFSKAPMGHKSLLGSRRMSYNPQGIKSIGAKRVIKGAHGRTMGARPNQVGREYESFTGFPHNLLEFPNVVGSKALHPTQKPLELCEYLIKTYTKPGDLVLDNCAGSGSTLVAAKRLKRRYIGWEWDPDFPHDQFYKLALQRLKKGSLE